MYFVRECENLWNFKSFVFCNRKNFLEHCLEMCTNFHSHNISGWMFLLLPAHPGCPGQNPQSRKTVECIIWTHTNVTLYAVSRCKLVFAVWRHCSTGYVCRNYHNCEWQRWLAELRPSSQKCRHSLVLSVQLFVVWLASRWFLRLYDMQIMLISKWRIQWVADDDI